MHNRTPPPTTRLLACLALAAGLTTACAAPSYYTQAASGHLQLMRQREPIADLLANPATDPGLRAKLELAGEIRVFASDVLHLPDSASYTQFAETGKPAISWNVVAAPEFSLEPKTWCFIVAGCVPYRGYFEQDSAKTFAGKLKKKGYDVSVTPAAAYSTLGWFDDPLLDTMLAYGEAELAAVLFHEMAHQQLYVKGDTEFNESFAGFVEETGVQLWLESRGREEELNDWKNREQASRQFQSLLAGYREAFARLYASGLPGPRMRSEKARLFSRLETAYQEQVHGPWSGNDYFGGWFKSEPNNARLALVQSYHGGTCAFENLFRQSGRDMQRFLQAAAIKSKLDAGARSDWLAQACPPIASKGNL